MKQIQKINTENYKNFLIEENYINNGVQMVFRFNNGYGASVVKHDFSYGNSNDLLELAVIEFSGNYWSLTYATSITNDVIGHLTRDGVIDILQKISKLKKVS